MKADRRLKITVVTSFFWMLLERAGTQGISLMVQIFLARLLLPEDFGVIAILTVFISFADLFVQSGLNTAIIQKKNVDNTDYSTVLFLSLCIASVFYALIFFLSPLISDFYSNSNITPILRIIAVILFIGPFVSIQKAYVARNMLFKKLFFTNIIALVISGVIGILTAYTGFGIWSLVIYQIAHNLFVLIILWFTIRWRPSPAFSFARAKTLFSFGWKLLAASTLNSLNVEITTLVIGKLFSPTTVGFFNRGKQYPSTIISTIQGPIQSVMMPAMAAQQEDTKMVKDMMRRTIITSSFVVFPLLVLLTTVAEPAVKVILTDKWLPTVPFLQLFCAVYVLAPIHTANLQALNALGRSDIFLVLQVIKTIIGLIILGISVLFGAHAIAVGLILAGILGSIINAHPNAKLLKYSYSQQIKDILPNLGIALFMGILVYPLNYLDIPDWLLLLIQLIFGTLVYIGFAKMFKLESLNYLWRTFKEIIKSK